MIVHIFVLNMVRNPNRWLPLTSTWLGEKIHAAGSLHRRSLLGPRNQMIPMHRQMFCRFCNRWAGPKGNPVLMAQSELLSQLVLCLIRFRIGIFQGLKPWKGLIGSGSSGICSIWGQRRSAPVEGSRTNSALTEKLVANHHLHHLPKNHAISGAIGFPECAAIGQKRRSASFFLSARSGSPDDAGSWTKVETFCTDVGLVS